MNMQDDRAGGVTSPLAPILTAGIFLGVGLGGFFDGIVFHQLLQWHHMLTSHGDYPMNTVPGLEVNTTWDGLFHMATWLSTVIGLALLWRAERMYDVRWSFVLLGALLMGWGGFNLVEGIIDHHILAIHHVRDDLGGPVVWDIGFLAWGAAFLVGGWVLVRLGKQRPGSRPIAAMAMPRRPSRNHAELRNHPRR